MLEYLEALCALPGVSGWEDAVRDYILREVKPYAVECITDSMGNLLVLRRGRARRARPFVVAAHMDEVGLIIKSVTDEGYLKFGFVGGVDRRVVLGKRVLVAGKYPGLVGVKAVHLSTKEERKNVPKTEELYLDIGANSRAQAEKLVHPGDFAVFDSAFYRFGDDMVKARAIDDRAGCAAMLSIIKQELPFDTWFAFTVQEEVGLRGATVAAQRLSPDRALILEGTTAADIPGLEGQRAVCLAGGGAVLGCMDRATIYDRAMFEALRALADANGIPWQIKRMIAGGTDAGIFHKTGAGARVASISVPVRYIHSPASVAAVSDLRALETLAHLFITSEEGAVCSC